MSDTARALALASINAADLGDDEPPCVEWADDVIDRARMHFTAEINGEN